LFDRSGCLQLVGRILLVGGLGYLLTMAMCWAVGRGLRDTLPADALMVGTICVGIPLWPALSLAAWWLLFESPRRCREAAAREALLGRVPLTDEAFTGLFPQPAIPAEVRDELRRLIGRPDVTDRLLPSDPIRATSELAGVCTDDLDWAEFLLGLESRLGIRLPDEAFPNRSFPDATVAEVVWWCEGAARQAKPTTDPARF
jgi:hypothetical protein